MPKRRDFIKGVVGLTAGLLAGSRLSETSERRNRQSGSDRSEGDNPARKGRTMIVDRQSRDWIENYCRFLGLEDLSKIRGGTAARILGL